jgi:hypothetical protein
MNEFRKYTRYIGYKSRFDSDTMDASCIPIIMTQTIVRQQNSSLLFRFSDALANEIFSIISFSLLYSFIDT